MYEDELSSCPCDLAYELEQMYIAKEMAELDLRRAESDIDFYSNAIYAMEQILNARGE